MDKSCGSVEHSLVLVEVLIHDTIMIYTYLVVVRVPRVALTSNRLYLIAFLPPFRSRNVLFLSYSTFEYDFVASAPILHALGFRLRNRLPLHVSPFIEAIMVGMTSRLKTTAGAVGTGALKRGRSFRVRASEGWIDTKLFVLQHFQDVRRGVGPMFHFCGDHFARDGSPERRIGF